MRWFMMMWRSARRVAATAHWTMAGAPVSLKAMMRTATEKVARKMACPTRSWDESRLRGRPMYVEQSLSYSPYREQQQRLRQYVTHLHGGGDDGDNIGVKYFIDCESFPHIIYFQILRAEYIQWLQQHSQKMSVFKTENQRVLLFTTMDSLFLLCAKYQKVKLRQ